MKLVQQPPNSSLCGPCVMAMLTNLPIDTVVEFMGSGYTYPNNLKKAAKHFGLKLASKSIDGKLPPQGVPGAAMVWGERQHWVAWSGFEWLDPAHGASIDLSRYGDAKINLYLIER